MSANSIVFGVRISLDDRRSPVTEDSDIGLYNVTSDMAANANSGQKNITVDLGSIFEADDPIVISDDNDSEEGVINYVVGNIITLKENLANSYTTAANGKVDGDSVFAWLQNNISSLAENWSTDMLVEKGVGRFTKRIDIKRGGNIASPGSFSCTVKNTSQFWNSLQDENIFLNGKKIEVFEFAATTKTRKWSGICNKPTWNVKKYKISAKGYHNKRITNIITKINSTQFPEASVETIDKDVPATFGEIKPSFDGDGNTLYNGYARFVRTANKEEDIVFENNVKIYLSDSISVVTLPGTNSFPVVGTDGDDPPIMYKIKIAEAILLTEPPQQIGAAWYLNDVLQDSGILDVTSGFQNKYLQGIEGTGDGDFRKIKSAQVDLDGDITIVEITIYDYFEETLDGNATATHDNQTWCKIIDVARKYTGDMWPCKNYLDENGIVVIKGLNLFSYDKESKAEVTTENTDANVVESEIQFFKLPEYAYKDSETGSNNELYIDVKLFNDDPDKMSSFTILPIENYRLNTEKLLTEWELSGDGNIFSNARWKEDGFYPIATKMVGVLDTSNFNTTFVTDRLSTTFAKLSVTASGGPPGVHRHFICTLFDLPSIKKNLRFDDLYLILKLKSNGYVLNIMSDCNIYVRHKKFFGLATEAFNSSLAYWDQGAAGGEVRSDPDFYYLDVPPVDEKNKYFYVDSTVTPPERNLWGYKKFDFGISNKSDYDSIHKCCLFLWHEFSGTEANVDMEIYQIAMAFKKKVSIKNAIYTPFQGRIFNDTWSGRKTSANLIESPIDVMEHFERLSNWDDSSPTPVNDWGKGYALGAKIKTGATNPDSFDYTGDANITVTRNYKVNNQIQKYPKGYTDKIKKILCRDFFLGTYYDKDGFASIQSIKKSETTPIDTVTLADIIDRKKISIKEANPGDIYPEPFIRYNKNFANGEYESIIKVTNVTAPTFSADYIKGKMGAASKEELWDKCAALYKKTGHLEKPPQDLTDKQWFNGTNADSMAQDCIFNWVDWMNNSTIQFPLHYKKAGDWEELHRFTLTLPHQTNDVSVECITTKVDINPNAPYDVKIEAIMFWPDDIPEDFNIKDTWINFGNDIDDWKDNWTNYGNDDDKKDVM